jgi:RHS repeat-associated protein
VVGVLALVAGASTVTVLAAPARPASAQPAVPAGERSVTGRSLPSVALPADPERQSVGVAPAPRWPAAATATATVAPAQAVHLKNLPITVAAAPGATRPVPVTVEMLGPEQARAFGGIGAAMKLSGAAAVTLSVDYSGFRSAFGGNLADRLRLVREPACAATGCPFTATAVPAHNDVAAATLTAQVDPSSRDVLVVQDGPSGPDSGDYRATDLRPSGKWQVGLPSGSFSHSLPLTLPPSIGDDPPAVSLDYDSGSVDGRTSATNNQASWVGLGWDLGMGFIERQYKSCDDDGDDFHADQCWVSPYSGDEDGAVYTISLNGVSTELIKTADGTFRMADDRGWKVEHLFNASNDDNTGEYWVVSTPDGVRHTFGQRTDSNWTVPVVGNNAGEPCHASAPVPCRQTWRWNLDRTVDPNGNASAIYWTKETNNYTQANGGATYKYDRGGYLDRIEYGMRDGEPAATQVDFTATPRCTQRVTNPAATCPAATASAGTSYPDVPVDLICPDGTKCTKVSPSFFTTMRLESISAKVWDGPTAAWREVTRWTPSFAFPAPPDGSSAALWLNSIQQTGTGGTEAVTLPPVSFDGVFLNNRQDYQTTAQQLQMRRVSVIHNGLGGDTQIAYDHGSAAATCPAGGENATWEAGVLWDQNHLECFRVRFKPEGATAFTKGVFHKYMVTKVDQVDTVGGSPTMTTTYSYGVDPQVPFAAWHRDDNLLVADANEDWTDWRGYQTVRVTAGTGGADRQSVTDTRYFQGMNGDKLASGTARPANVTDYTGHAWPDDRQLAGQVLQTQRYRRNADNSLTELAGERHTFWDSGVIADGPGLHDVRMVRPAYTYSRDRRADGTWRETSELSDGYTVANGGLATREADLGETGVADSTCTQTTYAQNTAGPWMLDFPEVKETHAGDPDAAGSGCPGPVVGRTVTLYDGAAQPGAGFDKPTKGNPTEVRSYTGNTAFQDVRHAYDAYGRELTTVAAEGTTSTSYSPVTGFPTGGITVTDPAGLTNTTVPSRAFAGVDDRTVDANNRPTTFDYDGVGRLRRVWLPTEPKTDQNPVPSYEFTYRTAASGAAQPTKPTVVTAKQLQTVAGATAGWLSTYTYLDGFGRTREVQAPSPGPNGGRTVAVTTYDDRGLTAGTSAPMWNATAPADDPGLLLNPAPAAIPSWTTTAYDALERETASSVAGLGTVVATTTTANYGNGTVVTPPSGGRTATWRDGHDRPAVMQQGVSAAVTGPQGGVPSTSYTYPADGSDAFATITDTANNVTRYTYDWLGHRLTADDPNAGPATYTYDPAGRLASTVDALGTELSYTYDGLDRKKATWAGDPQAGTKLAEWTYDTVPGAKGQVATATRFVNGSAYTTAVKAYDARYRVTQREWSIPPVETGLEGTYDITYGYDHADHRTDVGYPAKGGLPAETVHQSYTATGAPDKLTSELGTYVAATAYTNAGQLAGRTLAAGTQRTYTWQDTGQLRLAGLATKVGAGTVQDDAYSYDPVGNVTRIQDRTTGQSQCSSYDAHSWLAASWTTTAADCSGGVAGADSGGPSPFAQQFGYDLTGNLTAVTTGAATRGYTYPPPGAGSVHPQAVSSIGADTYAYDADGNQISRTASGVTTTSTYDEFGRLATSTTAGATTSYGYDADGTRLVRRDAAGITLYLDGTEFTRAGGTVTAVRYYDASLSSAAATDDTDADDDAANPADADEDDTNPTDADGTDDPVAASETVALRSPGGTTVLAEDRQSTVQLAIDTAALTTSRQRYLPYGAHRGGDSIAVTDRGYLGRVEDATTGLVALGARDHDPSTGQLTSPDPLLDTAQPTDQNAYSYAADNPVTKSDPSGLMVPCDNGHGGCGLTGHPGGGKKPAKQKSPSCWGWECTHGAPQAHSHRRPTAPHRPRATVVNPIVDHWVKVKARQAGGYLLHKLKAFGSDFLHHRLKPALHSAYKTVTNSNVLTLCVGVGGIQGGAAGPEGALLAGAVSFADCEGTAAAIGFGYGWARSYFR